MTQRPRRSIVLFCLRFVVLVAALVVLWWLLLPAYGYLLVQAAGVLAKSIAGVPIEYGFIRTEGILNTKSVIAFGVAGHEKTLPIALLVTNVPPYIALVLATLGLTWKRRVKILAAGLAILSIGHVLFLAYALHAQYAAQLTGESTQRFGELPTAIAQFYLTLPFLLWIVFAYWDRITTYLAEEEEETASPPR